ncbi:hypothetical protein NP493_3675g00004 [Ridgeia piscesae]|nr:hypothetical protein NP493_3675g00004 [Ridgeia piscesae]
MNQISKGERISNMPPLQIHTPSLSNVLDTLNLINGIVFVHISQEDIEKFRLEMVQRQQAADKSVTDCCGEDNHTSHGLPSSKSGPDNSTTEDKTETVLDTNENVTKDGELSDEASR